MTGPPIHVVENLDFVARPWAWPFADQRRADIAAHFAARLSVTPGLWNGRVLMMRDFDLMGRRLSGTWFETDFASFIAWRDWGFPEPAATNCFAMGALRSSDGAFLLGVMGAHTANAGRIYFPAGTPDPSDVVGGRVDLAGSVVREVAEETGLGAGDFTPAPDWQAVLCGRRIALMRVLDAPETAVALRARILAHLDREVQPEFADIRIVRGPADLDARMPDFVTAFLKERWR